MSAVSLSTPERTERALAALAGGAMLAVAGCVLQRMTGNPLASPEVLGISDRVYVMNQGRIVGELDKTEATQESVMRCIMQSSREG